MLARALGNLTMATPGYIIHNRVAGKHFCGPGVAGAGTELGIDNSVLNVLVTQPVLSEVGVLTGVQDIGADRQGTKQCEVYWAILVPPEHRRKKGLG